MSIYTKICSSCKIPQSTSEFNKDKSKKDGLTSQCKSCMKLRYRANEKQKKEYDKLYYENNKGRIKEYYVDNRSEIRSKQKEYRESNVAQFKAQRNRYQKLKYLTDPLYALRARIQSLVGQSLRKKGYTKKSRTYEILGCSYEEFKAHIESLFTEGMSWDNRDKWHIDHKRPISWAETEEQVIEYNHYTNLKPMWALDNQRKQNKFEG